MGPRRPGCWPSTTCRASRRISDALCQISTGGAHAARTLYSDDEETLLEAMKPIILNGIDDVVTRPDLADRAIFLTLDPIPDNKRRVEAEFVVEFESAEAQDLRGVTRRPGCGADQIGDDQTRRTSPHGRLREMGDRLPETAYWPAGSFIAAYNTNRKEVIQKVIDANSVAAAVQKLMEQKTEWNGTATELLTELAVEAGERISNSRSRGQPMRAPSSSRIRRSAPFLRAQGIRFIPDKGRSATARSISIIKSASLPQVRDLRHLRQFSSFESNPIVDTNDTNNDAKNGGQIASQSFSSPPKSLENRENDGDDANDGNLSTEIDWSKQVAGLCADVPSAEAAVREINCPSSVSSEQADKKDNTDQSGQTSATPERRPSAWRGRL